MPHIYIEPKVAYSNKDIVIYHTYEDGDFDFPYNYWFTLDKDTADEEGYFEFDIREFEIYDSSLSIEDNFINLIATGYITKDGWKQEENGHITKHRLSYNK